MKNLHNSKTRYLNTYIFLCIQIISNFVSASEVPGLSACVNSSSEQIKVMQYNLENLFNAQHEVGTNDYEYLPLKDSLKNEGCHLYNSKYPDRLSQCLNNDWTEAKYLEKLNRIANVVNKENPKILAVVEVENIQVVKDLADKVNLQQIFINNDTDKRGIQSALLISKEFNVIRVSSHPVVTVSPDNPAKNFTERDILEVEIKLKNGQLMSVFVNHWAAQMSPARARVNSAKVQSVLAENAIKAGRSVIVVGDFNTDGNEEPNALGLLKNSGLVDLYEVISKSYNKELKEMPLGTYFYPNKMSWQVLDRTFFNSPNKNMFDISIDSFRIVSSESQVKDWIYKQGYNSGSIIKSVPARFDVNTPNGISDHFPIVFSLCSNLN